LGLGLGFRVWGWGWGGSCPKMYLGSSSNSTHKLNLESAFGVQLLQINESWFQF